jgi:hypothetical protein
MASDEGQHTALTLDRQTILIRYDVKRINGPARKAIYGVEYVKGANQIEFVHRGHRDNDDPAGR